MTVKPDMLNTRSLVIIGITGLVLAFSAAYGSTVFDQLFGPLIVAICPLIAALGLGRFLPKPKNPLGWQVAAVILYCAMFLPIFSSPDIGTRFSVLASAFTYCGAISLQP